MKSKPLAIVLIVIAGFFAFDQARQAADRARYPRRGFGAVLANSTGERVDTIQQRATKDLVSVPDTTIVFRPTERELDGL